MKQTATPGGAQGADATAGRFEVAEFPGGGLIFTDAAAAAEPGFASDLMGDRGLRGEYSFFAIDGQDDSPAFLARDTTRYAHRLNGSVSLNLSR